MKNFKFVKITSLILMLFVIPELHAQRNIDLGQAQGDLRVLAAAVNDELGSSVAHGDINGDGIHDVL